MKLRLTIKFLLFMLGVFIVGQLLFPPPALEPDDPPVVTSAIETMPKPSKVLEVISVDPKFSKFEKAIIQEAVYNWEFYSDGIATFNITTGDPLDHAIATGYNQKAQAIYIKPITNYDDKTQLIDSLIGGTALGFYDQSTFIPTIWVITDRVQDSATYLAIVMHELGHSLGLEHTTHVDTLMYPYINGSMTCVTQRDLKELCKIYNCNTEKMCWCYPRTEGPICLDEESLRLLQTFSSP